VVLVSATATTTSESALTRLLRDCDSRRACDNSGAAGFVVFFGALCGDVTAKWHSVRPPVLLLADCGRPRSIRPRLISPVL
jgi:hypothetical protein